MDIEELQKRLDENTAKIMHNIEKINANEKKIQQNSYALEILKDYKTGFNRWHTLAIVFLILWLATIGYLFYVLNDTTIVDTTEITQESESGYNNYIGNDGDIINGKADN